MLIVEKSMTRIYRISDTEISVEGIKCVKEADGRYYPSMPELANVSLFPDAIDFFLELEKKQFLEEWDLSVNGLLKKLNISYGKN